MHNAYAFRFSKANKKITKNHLTFLIHCPKS